MVPASARVAKGGAGTRRSPEPRGPAWGALDGGRPWADDRGWEALRFGLARGDGGRGRRESDMLDSLRIDPIPFLLVMGFLIATTIGVLYGMYRLFVRLVAILEKHDR
jgi:hypothetical protein